MQGSVFLYNGSDLSVFSFTGTGADFINISAGLSRTWQQVKEEVAKLGLGLNSLMYISTTGSVTATLSNGSTPVIYGARFHGELSSLDAGTKLLECIRQLDT